MADQKGHCLLLSNSIKFDQLRCQLLQYTRYAGYSSFSRNANKLRSTNWPSWKQNCAISILSENRTFVYVLYCYEVGGFHATTKMELTCSTLPPTSHHREKQNQRPWKIYCNYTEEEGIWIQKHQWLRDWTKSPIFYMHHMAGGDLIYPNTVVELDLQQPFDWSGLSYFLAISSTGHFNHFILYQSFHCIVCDFIKHSHARR